MAADLDCTRDANGSRFQLKANPITAIPKPQKGVNALDRWLSEDEIKFMWNALPQYANVPMASALKLVLCCGSRVEEILNSRWDQIENDVLYLPTTKNGKPHEIVLNKLALGIIDDLRQHTGHCEVLFPERFATKSSMKSTSLSRVTRRLCDKTGTEPFTPRDLRRTYKSTALKHGIGKDILDKIQNYAQNDVSSKHYVRYGFINEKRVAVMQWNDILESILK